MKKICYDCHHRIVNVDESHRKTMTASIKQWKCKRDYWQDESICLMCSDGNRGWAEQCKSFKRISK